MAAWQLTSDQGEIDVLISKYY